MGGTVLLGVGKVYLISQRPFYGLCAGRRVPSFFSCSAGFPSHKHLQHKPRCPLGRNNFPLRCDEVRALREPPEALTGLLAVKVAMDRDRLWLASLFWLGWSLRCRIRM